MSIVIFVTTKNTEEAQNISQTLVKKKLIACANIISGVKSIFWWAGKVDRANETLLVIKSQKRLLNQIIATVKKIHSYDCPEIIALPIIGGNKDYLKWVKDSVK